MAGTVTITQPRAGAGGIKRVVFTWTSDASGNATGTTGNAIDGEIVRVVTNPGATAPSDNYDVVITDADGVDVLGGAGANRDTANSEQTIPLLETTVGAATYGNRIVVDGPLSLSISNAGDSKQGVVTVYYR